jgi:transcriptional regulator with XRE-family HTH domain
MKTNNILKKFGNKVKTLRLGKGWTQDELARRADLHRTYIGSIERYERNVSLLNVERIAKALSVNIKDLL